MNEFLVVGIENRTSKAGRSYYMLHLSQPFSDVKYGKGSKTSVEYVAASILPSDLKVGNRVQLLYSKGFDDKAFVAGVHIVSGDVQVNDNKNK